MPEQRVNGAKLFYELRGSGDPLVLVHGSWVDHKDWQLVVPHLAMVLPVNRPGAFAGPSPCPTFFLQIAVFLWRSRQVSNLRPSLFVVRIRVFTGVCDCCKTAYLSQLFVLEVCSCSPV